MLELAPLTGYTLDERDGDLFIVTRDTLTTEPVEVISWWATGLKVHGWRWRFPTGQEATAALPCKLTPPDRFGVYRDERGWLYTIAGGGGSKPTHFEKRAIAAPKVRKGTELAYRMGAWRKYNKSNGWVLA